MDPEQPQHLCADAGYKGGGALQAAEARDYQPHIKQRKEEAEAKRTQPGWKARRWVVERTHSWFNRYRKLLVSFEKTEASYVALLSLAAALICWRQTVTICGQVLTCSSPIGAPSVGPWRKDTLLQHNQAATYLRTDCITQQLSARFAQNFNGECLNMILWLPFRGAIFAK